MHGAGDVVAFGVYPRRVVPICREGDRDAACEYLNAIRGGTSLAQVPGLMISKAPVNRRTFLRLVGGGVAVLSVRPVAALAQDAGIDVPDLIRPYLTEAFGDWQLTPGRIELDMPVIAETGLSVPVSFAVESPMTTEDHVRRIMAFVPGNPEHVLVDYIIGPRAGIAAISTRVRIARSQTIIAAALMSDGSRWGTTFDMTVTRGACIDDIFLPDLRALEERERARAAAAAAAGG